MAVRALLVSAVGATALLAAGCGASSAVRSPSPVVPATELSIVVHPTHLEFITPTGTSTPFPTGPLPAGSRVLGTDDLVAADAVVGHDYEACTVSFDLHVLCDDILSFTGKGDLHAAWTFQWPASGTTGPASFDGIVDGGTGAYHNVRGDFHAQTLPNQDIQITGTLNQ
jgi:hypothetical protein